MVKESVITEDYALYCADCMEVMSEMPDNSVDLSVYSPPFLSASGGGLYNYSSHENDLSNSDSAEQFLRQYEFMVEQIARITKPGCISAVHVCDAIGKDGDMFDFPGEVKKIHRKYGFAHRNTITVWKEPLAVRMRTMVKSLTHKFIVEDSTESFTAMPDYILIFKKTGKREKPVEHPFGLTHYAGAHPLLPMHLSSYGLPMQDFLSSGDFSSCYDAYVSASFEALRKKYEGHKDPKTNKFSHIIWQRYASSVWDDVRIKNVLPYKGGKDEDDEKHVHPLQLDVIDRLVDLYSNEGEVVLTPFMGVGSEVYGPVSMGRKAVGIELKDSYFKQAVLNIADAADRFKKSKPPVFEFD